jgi:hypothetical protein
MDSEILVAAFEPGEVAHTDAETRGEVLLGPPSPTAQFGDSPPDVLNQALRVFSRHGPTEAGKRDAKT